MVPKFCPKCRVNVYPDKHNHCRKCGWQTEPLSEERLRWLERTEENHERGRKQVTAMWIIPVDEIDAAIAESRKDYR